MFWFHDLRHLRVRIYCVGHNINRHINCYERFSQPFIYCHLYRTVTVVRGEKQSKLAIITVHAPHWLYSIGTLGNIFTRINTVHGIHYHDSRCAISRDGNVEFCRDLAVSANESSSHWYRLAHLQRSLYDVLDDHVSQVRLRHTVSGSCKRMEE
jgi:hypothetical protein